MPATVHNYIIFLQQTKKETVNMLVMKFASFLFISVVFLIGYCHEQLLLTKYVDDSACPCSDPDLCKPLNIGPRKEIIGFVTAKDNWRMYNYTYLTTLAIFTELDQQLVCHAHQNNVRVVLKAKFDLSKIDNFDYRDHWISTTLDNVKSSFLDGINIDIEDPISSIDSKTDQLFMVFLDEIATAFHREIPGSSVSADVSWSPHCIADRCYDHLSMANYMDFLVVMSYDERSQGRGPCIANANSALSQTASGIREFVQLGIHPWKLVLGQPWYGYNYPCISLDKDGTCHLQKHDNTFNGVDCFDTGGTQVAYYGILKLMESKGAERKWNDTLKAPYFTYMDDNGTYHQVWYDDPESLGYKYSYGHFMGMRGLAFWSIDHLDYTDGNSDTVNQPMWSAIDYYFNDDYWYL